MMMSPDYMIPDTMTYQDHMMNHKSQYESLISSQSWIPDAAGPVMVIDGRSGQRYQQAIGPDVQPCELRQSTSSIKGINGQVNTSGTRRLEVCFQLESKEDSFAIGTIDSTELCNSDAPLLLSIKDQRRLQLQVNLGDENTPDKVYSRLLGGYLKVTDLNGLLGFHLLPSQIAMLGMHSSQEQTVTDTD